jgi:hypothetical protein
MKQIFVTFKRADGISYDRQLDQIALSFRQSGIKRYIPMYEKDGKIWMYFYGADEDMVVLKLTDPLVTREKNPKFFE